MHALRATLGLATHVDITVNRALTAPSKLDVNECYIPDENVRLPYCSKGWLGTV